MKNQSAHKPPYKGYVVSVLFIAFATIAKVFFFEDASIEAIFLLCFGFILCVLRYFGQSPAIFATILSGLVAFGVFTQPNYSNTPSYSYYGISIVYEHLVKLLLFWLECSVILVIFRDYTNRADTNSENLQRFRLLVEKSADGIALMKLDGSIEYCSPSVFAITGHSTEAFKKSDWWELLKPEEITKVKQTFYQVASQPGHSVKVLHRIKCHDGSFIWVENVITNLLEEPGVKAIILKFSNISDRIVHEQQMEDFIGIASHELKTPLTSLKAYTQVLEMRMKKENNTTSAILANKIDRQINRVVSMIFDLLDVTKFQSGSIQLNKADFDLNELITEIIEALQGSSQTHQIIADLDSTVLINGDRTRIGQVLTNLISNAIKYSPQAERVEVSSRFEGDFIRVEVRDYGIGIPQHEINNLFNRFYRVKSVKESFQGLGLGLYISSQIVSHHGGKMGVTSEEAKGSVFWFTLQLKDQARTTFS